MSDIEARPTTPAHRSYRIGGLAGFIPLNEELGAASTRGQRLPSLIQSRSSTSLFNLPRRETGRRRNSVGEGVSDDEERGPLDESSSSLRRRPLEWTNPQNDSRRMSLSGPEALMTPQMRSMRLIGKSNPRYRWHQYYKTEEQLKHMTKPLRKYYERCNYLIGQYIYIDKLLDSSLPHNLIQEYQTLQHQNTTDVQPLDTISEEPRSALPNGDTPTTPTLDVKVKRTPKSLYKLPEPGESTPLLPSDGNDIEDPEPPPDVEVPYESDEDADYDSPTVTFAIYLNLAANVILLIAKIAVIVLTSSLSVLASLVDAALDFLSTAIVWLTTQLMSHQDSYAYPIGRRRLEPVGVLVFSVIMITSFFQVALECLSRLTSGDHSIVSLGLPAIIIMLSTVLLKGICYFYCRFIPNSSVQALAQDALTDMIFNTFSIIFPLVGYYLSLWWADALGGLLLSLYVITSWSRTSTLHIRNLSGAAASADQRNIILYLTMRFAKTIKYIQGINVYHAGDKLNVEVDIVLDEGMALRDSHDLGESLQYVIESVPSVERAFVHADYGRWNLASHLDQDAR
jgi:cation diffusion facilitator family transporter